MKNYLFIILLLISQLSFAQNPNYDAKNIATIVSYNLENLFDTIDTPDVIDEEFTPISEKEWTNERYQQKLRNLDYVLSHINPNELPEIIAVQEVENKSVLEDLIKQEALAKGNYGIVHKNSPDVRGIDVALLYRKDDFKLLKYKAIEVKFSFEPETKTRDILYVKGELNGELLHIFANHWSSRRGGEIESEPKRVQSASIVRKEIDKILKKDKNAKIIVLGDFNDTPFNKSVNKTLRATNNLSLKSEGDLYNLMYNNALLGKGSHAYRGKWSMLDNIVVSYGLLNAKKGFSVIYGSSGTFFDEKTVFLNNKSGFWQPGRTYSGNRYYGGFSDHLPVYMQLKIK